ncbi:MAG: hypothetical protein MR304_08175 [Eubacterium sp.]|nr:hypothetical protein [Eubacterium sp.]
MSVNGITNATSVYPTAQTTKKAASTAKESVSASAEDTGVVYEASSTATDGKSDKITDYSSIVASMKKELSSKNEQLQNLVTQLLGKQAGKYTKLADLFKNINADPATIEQAKKDIGEDGYWGVEQTSDRLVSMAQALSGGNPEYADKMIAAIKKGFDQATEAWGEDLPDICKNTIDAAVKKMEDWRDSLSGQTAE